MAEATDRHALPLLAAGQAQKEVTHNEALAMIDGLLHPVVQARDLSAPPPAPLSGQAWIVGAGATGDWAGQADALALWTAGGWRFLPARAGLLVWLQAEGVFARHDGSQWRVGDWPVTQLMVGGVPVVGARQPAIAEPTGGSIVDVEARSAIDTILSALQAHGLIAAS